MRKVAHRRWIAFLAFITLIGVLLGSIGAVQAFGNHPNHLTGSVPLGTTINAAYGINGTGSHAVYKAATFTKTTGDVLTFTWTAGFIPTHIVIFQKNPAYDVHGLLNTSYYYQQLNVETSLTGKGYANLSSVYSVVGTIVNDTTLTSVSDKGFSGVTINQTWYDANTNNLNKTEQFSLYALFLSDPNGYVGYVVNVNPNGTIANSTMSLKVTQQFETPFVGGEDLYTLVLAPVAAAAVLAITIAIANESYHAAYRYGKRGEF